MSAVAAAARPAVTLPAPVASTVEFLRVMSRKPVGLLGLAGVAFFLFLAYVAPIFVTLQDRTQDWTQLPCPAPRIRPGRADRPGSGIPQAGPLRWL